MSDRDERLAALLNQLDESRRAGRPPAVEDLARANPELGDELRQLWAMAQFAQVAALPGHTHDTIDLRRGEAPSSGTLPREFGDYVLLQELGRGGMGIVYKARQKGLDRIVALKMLLHGDVASSSDRARIRAEARAAALLQHPNIVPVFEVGEAEGRDYFTMPFIEGRTLAQVLAAGPLPPRASAQLIAALARAVHHAHRQGVIHRDLKPGNVLIAQGESTVEDTEPAAPPVPAALPSAARSADALLAASPVRNPMIADFGLAKRLDPGRESITQTGAIIGTPSFMPPEQAASNRGAIGPASDIYALGAILYNCLTGHPPFQAATRVDTLYMVLEEDPVPPRLLNPRVDRDLELICLKCLQKAPDLRYPSAEALADDLDAFLQGEALSIGPGELRDLIGRLFRPTHHLTILENWGGLWMAHSLFTLLLCWLTWLMQRAEVAERLPFFALWGGGVLTWAAIFWSIRRRIGPVTFVERQIAHVWAAGVAGIFAVLLLEWMQGKPVLEYGAMLSVMAGMVFLCKAGILSGLFYLATGVLFASAAVMVWKPEWAMLIYGVALAGCYFVPGYIFYRRRQARAR